MAGQYPIDQILGKSLRFARNGVVYKYFPNNVADKVNYLKGSYFPCDFYVQREDGLWWGQFMTSTQPGRYVKHETSLFVPPDSSQTVDEQKKADADANKAWYERMFDSAGSGIIKIVLIGAGAWLIKEGMVTFKK